MGASTLDRRVFSSPYPGILSPYDVVIVFPLLLGSVRTVIDYGVDHMRDCHAEYGGTYFALFVGSGVIDS